MTLLTRSSVSQKREFNCIFARTGPIIETEPAHGAFTVLLNALNSEWPSSPRVIHLLARFSRQAEWFCTMRELTSDSMSETLFVRPVVRADYAGWRPLWDGYNHFYGRHGPTTLPEHITETTWERFFSRDEPVHAVVAVEDGRLIGLVHFLFHRSTTRLTDVCYLQDLFTAEESRGRGVGRQLVQAVYDSARAAGSSRVYWQTKAANASGRALYDKVADHHGFIVYSHEL